MKYLSLFHLQVRHAYYGEQPCEALEVVPSGETHKLLAGHRLLLRKRANGITVLAEATSNGTEPLIPISANTRFTFELQIRDPDYRLITDVSQFEAKTNPIFTNKVGEDVRETLTLQLIDAPSSAATAHRSIHRWNVLAGIELRLDSWVNDLSLDTKSYAISLQAHAAYWAYYLISNQAGGFSLTDTAGASPLTFNQTDLTSVSDPDPIDQTLSTQYPGSYRRVLFLSDTPVPCSMSPRAGIRLRLNGTNVSNAAMPNPSAHRIGRREEKNICYQVVKHIT